MSEATLSAIKIQGKDSVFRNPGMIYPERHGKLLHAAFVEKANEMLKHREKKFCLPTDEYKHYYGSMIRYFARQESFFESNLVANPDGASLNKGLLVLGNCGTGKSFIFDVLYELNEQIRIFGNNFSNVHSHEIVAKYDINGQKGIEEYYKGQRYFDDVGAEETGSHYKKSEIFQNLIERRHRLYLNTGVKTFMTSNLSRDEIIQKYGTRVESRLFEMFNIIIVGGNDFRKTK